MKPKLIENAEKVTSLDINRIEIVVDDTQFGRAKDYIEIYMLDGSGRRIEGGEFDRNEFMNAVLAFYNANF